jgi:hypothetical protein
VAEKISETSASARRIDGEYTNFAHSRSAPPQRARKTTGPPAAAGEPVSENAPQKIEAQSLVPVSVYVLAE